MEIDVTDAVEAFHEILTNGWPVLKRLAGEDTTGSYLDDWMEANWEMVIEASIPPSEGVVIEPYASGADCNIPSSRVWQPDRIPNTPVYVRYTGNEPLVNTVDGLEVGGIMRLSSFCTIEDGWPKVGSPFDFALLDSTDVIAIPAANLRYYVRRSTF